MHIVRVNAIRDDASRDGEERRFHKKLDEILITREATEMSDGP